MHAKKYVIEIGQTGIVWDEYRTVELAYEGAIAAATAYPEELILCHRVNEDDVLFTIRGEA
jgi:hypothetical protein